MPYLGLFLIGLAAGAEYTAFRSRAVSRGAIARVCVSIGLASVSVGIALKIAWLAAKPGLPQTWHPLLYWLTEPQAKIPPGPAYVLVYGGAGLVMAGLIPRMADTIRGERNHLVSSIRGLEPNFRQQTSADAGIYAHG